MPGTHLCGHLAGCILAGAAPETRDGFRDKGTKYSGQCARSDKTVSVRSGKTACIHPAKQRRSCRAKQRASVPANQQRSATYTRPGKTAYTRPGKTAYTRPGKTAAGPEGKMRVRDLRAVFRRTGRTYRPAGICGSTGPPGPTLPMPPDPGQHSSLQSRGQTVGRRTPSCRKNAPGRYGPTNRRYFLRFFKKMRRSVRYCEKNNIPLRIPKKTILISF